MANRVKRWAVGVAAAASFVAAPAIATATAGDVDVGPRLERACARADQLASRIQPLIRLLQAGPEVQGSLAWLQAQIDRAVDSGRTQLAEVLQNRYNVRAAKLELLKNRQVRLANIDAFCAEHGL